MPKSSRPNFLLFITDQHRADFLGCYGHPVLRTPHIDSIAARGTAFDRFYVASPVCQPNRASLMTGRMPSVHDVRSNGISLSMEAVTFVDLLRDAGYRTALIGKSHLQNFTAARSDHQAAAAARGLSRAVAGAAPGAARSSRRSEIRAGDAAILDQARRPCADAVLRLRSRHAGARAWRRGRAPTTTAGSMRAIPRRKNLLGPKNSLPHDYTVPQAYRTAIPEELYATAFLGERACAYLDEADRRRAVLPDGVVSRSAPSVQSARQILGHVQARAVPGAGGVLAQRLDAAGAGAEHHQGPREPARPTSPAWAPSACRRARRRRRGRSPAA